MVTQAAKYRKASSPSTGANDPYRALAWAKRWVRPMPTPVRIVQITAATAAPGNRLRMDGARGDRIQKEATNSATLRARANRADNTTPPDQPSTDPSDATNVEATIPSPNRTYQPRARTKRGPKPGRSCSGTFQASFMVCSAAWASPVAPQTKPATPMTTASGEPRR